jgi:hypothetical protein
MPTGRRWSRQRELAQGLSSPIGGLASAAFPSPIGLRIQSDLQAGSRPQRVRRLGSSVTLGDHADSTANREHDFVVQALVRPARPLDQCGFARVIDAARQEVGPERARGAPLGLRKAPRLAATGPESGSQTNASFKGLVIVGDHV